MSAPKTKSRIVDAAARLFREQGFHATGIATILREAEVNSGSLYHFFPSKESLLLGVLERYVELLRPVLLSPAEAATSDPIERVFALLGLYRAGLEATGCALGCPIGNLALELGNGDPRVRALIHQNFQNWSDGVERWLNDAGDRLPKEVDRRQLAGFVLTTMEGGMMRARAARSIEPFDAAVAQLRLYLAALQDRATSASRTPVTDS